MNEREVVDNFIAKPPSWLNAYPLLVAREWCVREYFTNEGVGDLVFADQARTKYMVVEVKCLNLRQGSTARNSRNNARQKAKKQAHRYGDEWAKQNPKAEVKACAYLHSEFPELMGPWLIQEKPDRVSPSVIQAEADQGVCWGAFAVTALAGAVLYGITRLGDPPPRR
jgi:hypothetical protein